MAIWQQVKRIVSVSIAERKDKSPATACDHICLPSHHQLLSCIYQTVRLACSSGGRPFHNGTKVERCIDVGYAKLRSEFRTNQSVTREFHSLIGRIQRSDHPTGELR